MGCTRIMVPGDLQDMLKSLKSSLRARDLDKSEERAVIRDALTEASKSHVAGLLKNPHLPGHDALAALVCQMVTNKNTIMTETERHAFPNALADIIEHQPKAMGIFQAIPAHRGPGASAVQHHFEISSIAALMQQRHPTRRGNNLKIEKTDGIAFGMKLAHGFAQPPRYGTIEADSFITRGSLLSPHDIGIDAKYSKDLVYKSTHGLSRQLEGIRHNLHNGTIQEFIFVSNVQFGEKFVKMVDDANFKIANDFVRGNDRYYQRFKEEYLTPEEKSAKIVDPSPLSTPLPEKGSPEYDPFMEKYNKFIEKYEIPQIDLCEKVVYE